MSRADGRSPDQLREIRMTRGWLEHAEGSVLVEFGATRVLCAASATEEVPRWRRGSGLGWVTAEYAMLPRATNTRGDRESVRGRLGGRTQEISRLVGRSLRACVDAKVLGENTIIIDCDVLQADGGTRGAARLILATRNPGKLAELRRILAACGVSAAVTDLGDVPGMPEVAETGRTFAENALLKARAVTSFAGLPAVADDSGLCVDALNGMPGVLSARWSGRHGDDTANLRLVLAQLADVPDERLGAHFACAAALALPDGHEYVVEGQLRGRLVREPRGSGGF